MFPFSNYDVKLLPSLHAPLHVQHWLVLAVLYVHDSHEGALRYISGLNHTSSLTADITCEKRHPRLFGQLLTVFMG